MASPKDQLSKLLRMTGLNAKYQDNRILLYNRARDFVSTGVSVNGFPDAIKLAQAYLAHLRSSGFTPLPDFAQANSSKLKSEISLKEVENRVDPDSSYYVSAMSPLSRINLLVAAKELCTRVAASRALREIGSVSESTLRRHKKIKRIASIYRDDSEKVC